MNSAFDAKQAPSYDFGILAIRTIGGKCPEWAERFPTLTGTPTIEILIVREASADFSAAPSTRETAGAMAPRRMLVVDDALAPENFVCDGAIWMIGAAARDLDVIAEACARLVCGQLIIGVDLGDAIEVAGGGAVEPPFGRGAAIQGIYGDDMRCGLEAAICSFAEVGFDGGAFILQSLSQADDKKFDLAKYDELVVQVLGRPRIHRTIMTAYSGACASAVITIAFRKQAPVAGPEV
jgi:hypothetical protein